jgi:hypothetical protein
MSLSGTFLGILWRSGRSSKCIGMAEMTPDFYPISCPKSNFPVSEHLMRVSEMFVITMEGEI